MSVSQHALAIPAMIMGIGAFVLAYSYGVRQSFSRELMSRKPIANCIRTAFGLRVVISIVFPIGGFNDLWVGVLSMSTSNLFAPASYGGSMAPGRVLLTTVIQGIYLNIEVFLVAIVFRLVVGVVQSLGATHERERKPHGLA